MNKTWYLPLLVFALSCKPGDLLDVPAPKGVVPGSAITSQSGAEAVEDNGVANVVSGLAGSDQGVLGWGGLLGDEFVYGDVIGGGTDANVDARMTAGSHGFQENGDYALQFFLTGRITLLTALPLLQQYEPAPGRPRIALAFALIGYAELFIAEDYCAGLPLDAPTADGIVYGTATTTDSLLGVAEAHFDSAVKYAGSDPVTAPLASVGLGRARLDRANFAGAASAVASVPTSFVYNAFSPAGGYNQGGLTTSNLYGLEVYQKCGEMIPANRKGQNGLNYISANDPRLVFDSTMFETCDAHYYHGPDSVFYYPLKFGNPSTNIPLASGIEARLIEAEAALHGGQAGAWAADLNALRATVPMPSLTTDSTTNASAAVQIDVMFRERAFWLYGQGSRLGDMRRLVRQYGRDQSTVFPVGPYWGASIGRFPTPLPSYGTDVSLTLPTSAGSLTTPDPNYKGCTSKGA